MAETQVEERKFGEVHLIQKCASGLATSVAEDFRMIIRVIRLQVISVKYACVMDIIRVLATSRAVVTKTQGLLEPNKEVGEERYQRGGYRGDRTRASHVIDEEKEQRYNAAAQEDDRMLYTRYLIVARALGLARFSL